MKKIVKYKDVVDFMPCYDPAEKGMNDGYAKPIAEFIKEFRGVIPQGDVLWVVCRKDYMTEKNLRLFAVWCAREALKLDASPDQRSLNACDVAERFANNKATTEELCAARAAAWNAARDATWDATGGAAKDAAWSATKDAAWSAAWGAAWGAAMYTTWSAAKGAARGATVDTAMDAQLNKLLTYF